MIALIVISCVAGLLVCAVGIFHIDYEIPYYLDKEDPPPKMFGRNGKRE